MTVGTSRGSARLPGVAWLLLAVAISLTFAVHCVQAEEQPAKEPLWTYQNDAGRLWSLSISNDGKHLAAVGAGNRTVFFQTDSSTPAWVDSTTGASQMVRISGDGNYLVTSAWYDQEAYLYGKASASHLWTNNDILNVAISDDGSYMVGERPSSASKIYLLGKDSGTPIWTCGDYPHTTEVDISGDGEYLVAGSFEDQNTTLSLFNKNSSTAVWDSTIDGLGAYQLLKISADGNYIVAVSGYGPVVLWNRNSSTPLWQYNTTAFPNRVAISADGAYIAATTSGTLYLFHKDSPTPLWTFHKQKVAQVAFSGEGEYLALSTNEDNWKTGKVYLFDTASSTPLWNLTLANTTTESLTMAQDAELLAVSTNDGKLHLLDFKVPVAAPAEEEDDDDEEFPWLYLLIPLILAVVLIALLMTRKAKPLAAKPRYKPSPPADDVDLEHCIYCGSSQKLHKGHLIAPSQGGQKPVSACETCNTSKGRKAFMEWLRWVKREKPEQWESIIAFNKGKRGEVPRKVQKIRDE